MYTHTSNPATLGVQQQSATCSYVPVSLASTFKLYLWCFANKPLANCQISLSKVLSVLRIFAATRAWTPCWQCTRLQIRHTSSVCNKYHNSKLILFARIGQQTDITVSKQLESACLPLNVTSTSHHSTLVHALFLFWLWTMWDEWIVWRHIPLHALETCICFRSQVVLSLGLS